MTVFRWNVDPARAFDSFIYPFDRSLFRRRFFRKSFPAINLYMGDDDLLLTAEIPGVEDDDLDVSVTPESITLKGKRMPCLDEGCEEIVHRSERGSGSFVRTIDLPVKIDSEKIEATYENGILKVFLPKAPEAKPKTIKIITREQ